MFTKLRGAVYAALFVLLWWWVAASVRPLDSRIPISIPAPLRALGVFIATLGAILAFRCVWLFATRGRGTPAPFDAPREFVAVGPYRYVRNPMYIGGAGVIFGFGLILRSPAILALSFAFLLLAHLFVVLYEERSLARRFGSSYSEYRRSVHRWLPRRPADPASESRTSRVPASTD